MPEDAQRFDETLIVSAYKRPPKKERISRIDPRSEALDKADLVELYRVHRNYETIGDMFGVTGRAISRRIKLLVPQ